MVVEAILCLLLLILAWSWIVYPLVMVLLSPDQAHKPDDPGCLPPVIVFLSAHNEEIHIEARLKNLLAQDYKGETSIWVGVDGSSDKTAELAAETAKKSPVIQVRKFDERQGKMAVLKRLVADARAKADRNTIFVFTDANTSFHVDAIRMLICRFAGNKIGGVCGRLVLKDKLGLVSPESSYWNLENKLKLAESNLDSCLGANGAIYAIRKDLFPGDLPDDTIIDDFVIGMKVREKGQRFVYEPEAVAEEDLPDIEHEWARRVRIGSGDLQALWLCRKCLSPFYGSFTLMYWSHKVLRWLTPVLAIIAIILALVNLVITRAFLAADVVVILLAVIILFAALMGGIGLRFSVLAACDHFVTMQLALVCGYFKFLTGGARGHWQRTPR